MADIAFSSEMNLSHADEVEVRPITARGRDYFQLRFSPGVVSARLQKHAALAMEAMIESAGLTHAVDDFPQPPESLPALMQRQAD